MVEVKEILRLWLDGRSLREVTRLSGVDRKPVRRYVDAAKRAEPTAPTARSSSPTSCSVRWWAVVRPERLRGTGTAWEALAGQREQIGDARPGDPASARIIWLDVDRQHSRPCPAATPPP